MLFRSRKRIILRHNLRFFRGLDALVSPERTCIDLRKKCELKDLIMIHTRHGAGDREGGFDDRSLAFDFTLLSGRKYAERLTAMGFLPEDRFAVVGYPKFEVVRGLKRKIYDCLTMTTPSWYIIPISISRNPPGVPWGCRFLNIFSITGRPT